MNATNFLAPLAVALALSTGGAAHAAITAVGTAAGLGSSSTAAGPAGTDTFSDLTINTSVPGPLSRVTGQNGSSGAGSIPAGYAGAPATGAGYAYTIGTSSASIFVVPNAGNPGASTENTIDIITLGNFGPDVLGFGATFFGSNQLGESGFGSNPAGTPVPSLTLTVTNLAGESTGPLVLTAGAFRGFLSDSPLASVTLAVNVQNSANSLYPTLDTVILTSVPEPGTCAMLAAGLAFVGGMVRRRARA